MSGKTFPPTKSAASLGGVAPEHGLSFVFIILPPLLGAVQTGGMRGNRGQKVDRESSEGPGFSTGSLCSHEGSHSLKALVSSSMEGKLCVCALNLKTWKITPSHLTLKGQ